MPTRPHTSGNDSPCGLKLRGINHTPHKYYIRKIKPGSSTNSGFLHTQLRKGAKGEGDARKIHDSHAQKARDARKLRSRVEKHAAAMLAAIELQEHELDNSSFKAKHMNLEQEMELMLTKTAHMDVTAWSKKMLEESKHEVRELREQLSILTNRRLKCENELVSTKRSLDNTERAGEGYPK